MTRPPRARGLSLCRTGKSIATGERDKGGGRDARSNEALSNRAPWLNAQPRYECRTNCESRQRRRRQRVGDGRVALVPFDARTRRTFCAPTKNFLSHSLGVTNTRRALFITTRVTVPCFIKGESETESLNDLSPERAVSLVTLEIFSRFRTVRLTRTSRSSVKLSGRLGSTPHSDITRAFHRRAARSGCSLSPTFPCKVARLSRSSSHYVAPTVFRFPRAHCCLRFLRQTSTLSSSNGNDGTHTPAIEAFSGPSLPPSLPPDIHYEFTRATANQSTFRAVAKSLPSLSSSRLYCLSTEERPTIVPGGANSRAARARTIEFQFRSVEALPPVTRLNKQSFRLMRQ